MRVSVKLIWLLWLAVGGCVGSAERDQAEPATAARLAEPGPTPGERPILEGVVSALPAPADGAKVKSDILVHLAPLGSEAWPGNQDPYDWYLQQGTVEVEFNADGKPIKVTYDMYICSGWDCPASAFVHLGAVVTIDYTLGIPSSVSIAGCVSFRSRTIKPGGGYEYGPWEENCDQDVVSQYLQGFSYNINRAAMPSTPTTP